MKPTGITTAVCLSFSAGGSPLRVCQGYDGSGGRDEYIRLLRLRTGPTARRTGR